MSMQPVHEIRARAAPGTMTLLYSKHLLTSMSVLLKLSLWLHPGDLQRLNPDNLSLPPTARLAEALRHHFTNTQSICGP